MLTARGWWFLVGVGLLTLVGVTWLGTVTATVPLLGLTLLLWFAFEWVLFEARYRSSADRFVVSRELRQGGRTVPAVWAGATVTVRVAAETTGPARLPFVVIEDRLPPGMTAPDSGNRKAFDLRPGQPAVVEYPLAADSPGVLRFEGVTVRVADLAGLFYRRTFIRRPTEVLVLPPLTDDEGRQRGAKRFNTLPPPGVHRLRRPGGGSELLDLRDYRPGDPPKMIAWKPSARRDKLITKEFESDVPVRCVLFVDASNGARVGPPDRAPVVRLATVAAGVAQAAAGNRDLVGLTVFDEAGADVTKPARTRVHMVHLLRKLAEAAARLPDPGHTDADLLARYAFPVASEIYPDLLAKDVNSRPLGMYWIPISDTRWVWVHRPLLYLPWVVLAVAAGLLIPSVRPFSRAVVEGLAAVATSVAPQGLAIFALAAVIGLPAFLALIVGLYYGARGLLAPYAPRTARRKQLAALFAALDGAGPAEIERHRHDNRHFVTRATRFLLDHRIRLPLILTERHGRYRFRSEGKVAVLADSLVRSVSRARDNELYVVLADLAELSADVGPLVKAAKVARARHHQVLVIVPWPVDVSTPDDAQARATRRTGSAEPKPGFRIGTLVKSVLAARYQKGYAAVRAALAKSGATVVRVEDGDPVQLVLDRLDRLRGSRVRR